MCYKGSSTLVAQYHLFLVVLVDDPGPCAATLHSASGTSKSKNNQHHQNISVLESTVTDIVMTICYDASYARNGQYTFEK